MVKKCFKVLVEDKVRKKGKRLSRYALMVMEVMGCEAVERLPHSDSNNTQRKTRDSCKASQQKVQE